MLVSKYQDEIKRKKKSHNIKVMENQSELCYLEHYIPETKAQSLQIFSLQFIKYDEACTFPWFCTQFIINPHNLYSI